MDRRVFAGSLAGLGLARGAPATAESATPTPTPPPIERDQDVIYGVYGENDGHALYLDAYRPTGWDGPRPAVLLFHGGGLVTGSRVDVAAPARSLAMAGYVAFTVDYRLFDPSRGGNPWPAQLDDAQRAVRWVRAHAATYGVDPDRVAAYGPSSGGTLATAVGVRETRDDNDPTLAGISSRVTCVVDLSGDVDLTIPYPDPSWSEINAAMLGGTPDEQPAAYRDASPLSQVDAESVPFLVIHGVLDDATPVEHSRRLVAALQEARVEVTYGEYPRANHLTTADWAFSGPWVLTFLGLHLHPER